MFSSRTVTLVLATTCSAFLTACHTPGDGVEARMPDREQSRLFTTERADFMIVHGQDAEQPDIHYRLRVSPNQPLEEPIIVHASFENPASPNRPVTQQKRIEPASLSFQLESPAVWGLEAGKVYQVVIEAYDLQGQHLGTHRQGVFSSIDTRYPNLQRGT